MVEERDALEEFASRLKEIEGLGIHKELAKSGKALEILKQLGHAERFELSPDEFGRFELPAYGTKFTDAGDDGFWWDKDSHPLTVQDWLNREPKGEQPGGGKFKYWRTEGDLATAGPSLAIRDMAFADAPPVLVDGCHRGLVKAERGLAHSVIVYFSYYAHLIIFPSHFLSHALNGMEIVEGW